VLAHGFARLQCTECALERLVPFSCKGRQVLFEPLTLLEKLAALIPRPRINLVVYHGVLAPHCGWRARVVAYGAPPAVPQPGLGDDRRVEVSSAPLGVGRADAARVRRRRAGVPALRRGAATDRDGRGPRGDRRDPGGRVARGAGAGAAQRAVQAPDGAAALGA
jgi:hypothetical protein